MSGEFVLKYAESNNMHVLFHEECTAWLPEKKKSTKYLVITDRILGFFDSKAKTLSQSFFWVNIDSLNCKTDKNKPIELSFLINEFDSVDVSFSLKKTKSEKVVGVICDLLPRILPESANEKLKLFRFITESPPITGCSIHSRMLGLYESKAGDIPNHFDQLIEKKIMLLNPTMNTEQFKVANLRFPEFYDSIFQILPFLPFVNTFMLFDKSAFIKLKEYKNQGIYQFIHHLYIQCTNERFNTFIEDFPSLQNDINAFSFDGTNFKESHIDTFFNSIQNKTVTSIGFHSQSVDFRILTSPKFTENLAKISSKLKFLSFANFDGFVFDQIATQLSFITVLSLSKCNLDIGPTFQQIIDLEFKNLSELDLSENKVVDKLDIRGNLPPSLSKIVVTNIAWGKATNLIKFILRVLSGMNSILKLNLSKSTLSDGWNKVFQMLADIDTDKFSLDPVTTIGWDGNPISDLFFIFLSECKNLSSLSLSGCFNVDSDSTLYTSFIDFLNKAQNIQTLILRGAPEKRIRNNIYGILESLSKLNSLQKLDISDNEIGDEGLTGSRTDSLITFLKKKPRMVVAFEGSTPSSLNTYLELYKQAPNETKLCYPIHDSFPYEQSDAKYIDEIKSLSQKMFVTPPINLKWKNDGKQKLISRVTQPDSNPLDKPYFAYFDHDMDKEFHLPIFVPITYVPVPVKPITKTKGQDEAKKPKDKPEKSEKKLKKGRKESEYEYEEKKKRKTPKKGRNEYSDSDYEYEEKRKRKKSNKRGKSHKKPRYSDYSEESDEYVSRKPRPKPKNKRSQSPKKVEKNGNADTVLNYLEKKDSHTPKKSTKAKKIDEKKQLAQMQTVLPSKKSEKLTKRKKSEMVQITSDSDPDLNPRKKSSKTKRAINKFADDQEYPNYIEEPKFKNPKQKRVIPEPVHQRPPPELDSSYDNQIEPPFSKKSKIEKNFYHSDDNDKNDDDIIEPKPPQWDFPLYYIPDPNDCDQIVGELNEKFSVANLLTYMIND